MLNGRDLPKDLHVPVKDKDILTLLELQHPITIEVHSPEQAEQAVDKSALSAGSSSSKQQVGPSNVKGLRDALFSLPIKEAQHPSHNSVALPQVQRMDMDDSPENTSDSELDDKEDQRLQNTSDVSAESSLICEDLSDLEDNSNAGKST
ncbi:hypothetical protein BGZ68_009552 [Mortierella alpina]|nr:hypothetical protein BGZ68_009552 [Mortierella alpina]